MDTKYYCEKCGAVFFGKATSKLDALKCNTQPAKPRFQIGEKCLFDGKVVVIIQRSIVQYTHHFIYRFEMRAEDNPPGTILFVCDWKEENEFQKLKKENKLK